MKNNEVKEITFKTKYVSGEALKVLTTFIKSKYIIKGSTGIGGTTAVFNTNHGNRIIISPNVGMIKGKELKRCEFVSDKQAFIYSKSADKWEQVEDYLVNSEIQSLIINTTPEQILQLYDNNRNLYNLLIDIPIFIDEIHSYSVDNSYRESVGAFMELVYNEWLKPFILSTASPVASFIDIPKGIDIECIKVSRENEPTKQLHYSTNLKDVTNFIEAENAKGNLVVLFTNDKKYHTANKAKKVKNLVGNNLKIKIAPYKRTNNINDSDLFECDLLVCSSAYFAGFDIPVNCSICIVSNQSKDAYKICVNNVVQAYGRCRGVVQNALFINGKSKINNHYPTSKSELNGYYADYLKKVEYYTTQLEGKQLHYQVKEHKPYISEQLYVNRGALVANTINKLHDYQLYNDEILRKTFEGYNFNLIDYIVVSEFDKELSSYPFKERLTHLMNLSDIDLTQGYKSIKNNFKSKGNGAFSSSLAIEYLTAYLIKVSNMSAMADKLHSKRLKVNEFYKSFNVYLRVNSPTEHLNHQLTKAQYEKSFSLYGNNPIDGLQYLIDDWHYLYAIYKLKNGMFDDAILRELDKYEQFHNSDLYTSLFKDKPHRVRNARNSVIKTCEGLNIELADFELFKLDECINHGFNMCDYSGKYNNYHTAKHNVNKMVEVIGYMLTNEGVNFEVKETKNRSYNPITQLPSALRRIVPIKYVEIDITSANPQIVDRILGSNIGLDIYQNLMKNRGVERYEAKKLYNTFLNNHRATVKTATKFYLSCGYPNDKAMDLAKLTAQVKKGSFYESMTASESVIIFAYEQFLSDNGIKSLRFHDAVLIKETDAKKIHLPTEMKNYKFHLGYFNNDEQYINKMKNNELIEVKTKPQHPKKRSFTEMIAYLEDQVRVEKREAERGWVMDLCTDAEEWTPSKTLQIITFSEESYKREKQLHGDIVTLGW
ncbi:hypothetical protein DHD32_05675 [Arenibacter sp. TNZ]|uniref:hypothetical protein n=1 Tax=Arenibacter TaxID=178469 RepID=UPI000CD40CF0|nr:MULTISPECIES: hypothetical protein [Arenibacter]MCM4170958.1 hypothetical protein [Arenibacter sp. TNZ]